MQPRKRQESLKVSEPQRAAALAAAARGVTELLQLEPDNPKTPCALACGGTAGLIRDVDRWQQLWRYFTLAQQRGSSRQLVSAASMLLDVLLADFPSASLLRVQAAARLAAERSALRRIAST